MVVFVTSETLHALPFRSFSEGGGPVLALFDKIPRTSYCNNHKQFLPNQTGATR